jgi:hypothetical protein
LKWQVSGVCGSVIPSSSAWSRECRCTYNVLSVSDTVAFFCRSSESVYGWVIHPSVFVLMVIHSSVFVLMVIQPSVFVLMVIHPSGAARRRSKTLMSF